MARLIVRMSGTCDPTWKWINRNASAMPASCSRSLAVTKSAVDSPNFAFSPPLVAHFPAPLDSSRTRSPIIGATFDAFATSRMCVNSSNFSTTRMTIFPNCRPSSAIRMSSVSL